MQGVKSMFAESTYRRFYGVKAKYDFFKFVKNPTNTLGIFEMTSSFQKATHPDMIRSLLVPLLENTQIEEDYESNYWPKLPTLAELKQFPEKSFGREAAIFFDRWNLDPDLFPEPDFSAPQNYITSRVYQAHDFWHVLTGYDTTLENELALQAFGIGQYKLPISLAIIAGGIMNLLQKSPEKAFDILTLISEGFMRGKRARNLLTAGLLERLPDPLSEVRQELDIQERKFYE